MDNCKLIASFVDNIKGIRNGLGHRGKVEARCSIEESHNVAHCCVDLYIAHVRNDDYGKNGYTKTSIDLKKHEKKR